MRHLISHIERPSFRQDPPIPGELPLDREVGAAICACNKTGEVTLGAMAIGPDQYTVSVPISCPSGHRAIGVWHTHPGGVAEPSQADRRQMRQLGLKHACITVPDTGETRCHLMPR